MWTVEMVNNNSTSYSIADATPAGNSFLLSGNPKPERYECKTIDAAIAEYLRDVKATKSPATYKASKRDLVWFRK